MARHAILRKILHMQNKLKYVTLLVATILCVINNRPDFESERMTHLNLQLIEGITLGGFLCSFIWVLVTKYTQTSELTKTFLVLGLCSVVFFLLPTVKYESLFFARITIYLFSIVFFVFLDILLLLDVGTDKKYVSKYS